MQNNNNDEFEIFHDMGSQCNPQDQASQTQLNPVDPRNSPYSGNAPDQQQPIGYASNSTPVVDSYGNSYPGNIPYQQQPILNQPQIVAQYNNQNVFIYNAYPGNNAYQQQPNISQSQEGNGMFNSNQYPDPYYDFLINECCNLKNAVCNLSNEKRYLLQQLYTQNWKMQQQKQRKPRVFRSEPNGLNESIEPSGKIIEIGYLSIRMQIYVIVDRKQETVPEKYIFVKYAGSDRKENVAFIPEKDFLNYKLLEYFETFYPSPSCRKELSNLFLYDTIVKNIDRCKNLHIPCQAGFSLSDDNKSILFYSASTFQNTSILKWIDKPIQKRVFKETALSAAEILQDFTPYFNDTTSQFLHTFRIASILSTVLEQLEHPLTQILILTGNESISQKITDYLQVFNRPDCQPISLRATKTILRNAISTAKDEVVVLHDMDMAGLQRDRSEKIDTILQEYRYTNSSSRCNIAILSNAAPYLLPTDTFFAIPIDGMDQGDVSFAQSRKRTTIFESFDSFIVNFVCRNYDQVKENLSHGIQKWTKIGENSQLKNSASIDTFSVLMSVLDLIEWCFDISVSKAEMQEFLLDGLQKSHSYANDHATGIYNEFSVVLNQALENRQLVILEHGYDMCYTGDDPHQVIRKDAYFYFNADTLQNILLPKMTITQNLQQVLKALKEEDILFATKKNRQPLTVYNSDGISVRLDFIAMQYHDLVTAKVHEMIEDNMTAEYFTTTFLMDGFIPLLRNHGNQLAGKQFLPQVAENQHISVTGRSGQGKSVFLSQLICSMQKLGNRVIVFDANQSFEKETLEQNLSKDFVNAHVSFHSIETDGLPIQLFKFHNEIGKLQTRKMIVDLLAAPLNDLSQNQITALKRAVDQVTSENEFSFSRLIDAFEDTKSKSSKSLLTRLYSLYTDISEYGQAESSWNDFFAKQKDVIVISVNGSIASTGNQLIDILIASLYFYQVNQANRNLSIVVDEVQNQNLTTTGPIAKILKEGRKHHIGLIYAMQTVSKRGSEQNKILKQAATHVYFRPDIASENAAAEMLGLKPNEQYHLLRNLDIGECFMQGTFYNFQKGCNEEATLRGRVFLHNNTLSK